LTPLPLAACAISLESAMAAEHQLTPEVMEVTRAPIKTKKGMKKKAKGKAMKKGGHKKAPPAEGSEPAAPKIQKLPTRKRLLLEIGDTPIASAIKQWEQKVAEALRAVQAAERAEVEATKKEAALEAKKNAVTKEIDVMVQAAKEVREKYNAARMKTLDIEKEHGEKGRDQALVENELAILEGEIENESKRNELKEAKRFAKEAMEAAKQAKQHQAEALKEANKREAETANRAKTEEVEARKQAKEMALMAREKAFAHKKQELAEKLREKQERVAALGGGKKAKKAKIADGEDVD